VELLQAIHEDRIGGWRRTSPYIAIAESLSSQAEEALESCALSAKAATPPPVVVKPPEPAPVPAPAPPAVVVNQPVVAPVPQPIVQPVGAPVVVKADALIILSEHVFFAFGRADVTPAGDARMREVAAILNMPAARDRKVFINGYTDDVGDSAANLSLSERRAEAVRRSLIANGIYAMRLTVRGFGETNLQPTAVPKR
jgi:outer membrane protein OmpA-like peptidoglycan-associated protein